MDRGYRAADDALHRNHAALGQRHGSSVSWSRPTGCWLMDRGAPRRQDDGRCRRPHRGRARPGHPRRLPRRRSAQELRTAPGPLVGARVRRRVAPGRAGSDASRASIPKRIGTGMLVASYVMLLGVPHDQSEVPAAGDHGGRSVDEPARRGAERWDARERVRDPRRRRVRRGARSRTPAPSTT